MRKAAVAVVVLGLMALGAYVGWRGHLKLKESNQTGRRAGAVTVPVEVAPVVRATLRDVGRFTGSLTPDAKFLVAPRVAGRLEKLLVNIGDAVDRGQQIAVLDDKEFVQQADRAKAELAVATANVVECQSNRQTALREFERADALWRKKIASDSEYEQAKGQYEVHEARCRVAAAQVDQKSAALKEAEIRLSYTRIHAAWEGGADTRFVGERYVDEGALLTANSPIVSILDISTLTAAVYVIERDYAKIAIGQQAKVSTDAFRGRVFGGQVARIAPELQEASRQGRVEVAVPNPERLLKPGMFVRVELEFAERSEAAAVPVAAVVRRDGRQGVFVADQAGRTARFVPVQTGVTSGGLVEILSPELDGPVVVMGQHLLADGSAITVVPREGPATMRDRPAPAGRSREAGR